jgi:nucleoside-diphosphate-sugar epimerase
MRIVIIGANGKMGRGLVPALAQRGHEISTLVRKEPVGERCITDWQGNPRAAEALRAADSIVNLAGSGNPPRGVSYDEANAAPARRVLELLGEHRAPHLVFISYPGASAGATSAYLTAKACGEEISRRSAKQVAILRTSFVCGSRAEPLDSDRPFLVAAGKRAPMFGRGDVRCRPLCLADVVTALVATVEQRLAGEFALEGPDEMTLVDIARTLNANPGLRFRRLPGWLALAVAPLLGMRRDFVRFFLADALEPSPNVFAVANVDAHRLAAIWSP